jgi:hypothetical protein
MFLSAICQQNLKDLTIALKTPLTTIASGSALPLHQPTTEEFCLTKGDDDATTAFETQILSSFNLESR